MPTKTNQPRAAQKTAGGLRRIAPTALPPTTTTLRRLEDDDREALDRLLSEPTECLYHPSFRRQTPPEAPEVAVIPMEAREAGPETVRAHAETIVGSGSTEVLTADDERALFMRFNYCRHRIMRVLRSHRGKRLTAAATRDLLKWDRMAMATRAMIVRANTSLVLAMARRSRNSGVELSELVSEGNLALLRCVDKFDASRGFKFSTYACRAILASFSRAAAKAARVRSQFPTAYDPAMERSDYLDRKRENIEADCVDELRRILFENSAELSSVERRVLDARFLLNEDEATRAGKRRRTLDQVGSLLGVSKERVRQIQNQAMDKLRNVLEEHLPVAG